MLFDFEKEALAASGVRGEFRIQRYLGKLSDIYEKFVRDVELPSGTLSRSQSLFDWLWLQKPARYQRGGSFKLSNAIDSQLAGGPRPVGNCLGLTLLYTCLARKMGIQPGTVYIGNAFGIGPHVLSMLSLGEKVIDIEHIFPHGFDYKGHLDASGRTLWGEKDMVAEIHHSLGNRLFEQGELSRAMVHYDMALRLNPRHGQVCLNRIILLDKMQMESRR